MKSQAFRKWQDGLHKTNSWLLSKIKSNNINWRIDPIFYPIVIQLSSRFPLKSKWLYTRYKCGTTFENMYKIRSS